MGKKIEWNGFQINELVVDGNAKIGKGVGHFSTLAGTDEYTHSEYGFAVKGTCPCNCVGCYGQRGNYCFRTVRDALAMRTFIARTDLYFLESELIIEIKKHKFQYFRIHATGDFFGREYVEMWQRVVRACGEVKFWTYTKAYGLGFDDALNSLNSEPNCNIVDSVIKGHGFNFGHCDYLIKVFDALLEQGEQPYICPCGIDKNQHCNNCTGCATHKYVLFVEHSTSYKAEKDPDIVKISDIINKQREATA